MYITPITKVFSTYTEAKEFFTEYGGVSLFDVENRLKIADLAQGKRNLIVGEPGIGKTFLLQQIKEWLDKEGATTNLISLRQTGAIELIDEFLDKRIDGQKVLLLDALDEVRSSLFPSVLQKIEEVSKKCPELSIYLSSRWVFISRHATSFPEYRFITISPFTRDQVRKYLIAAGRSGADVDALLNRVMSFSHRMLVIQVPRYLSYLDDFLKLKGVDAAAQVSRNELFEHFIYSKLELEDKKLITDKKAIIKRVLEKLAVTMEIYQSNTISKDELMTFFDDVKSDLKQVALSQISLDVFYEYSLLKVGQKNLDEIEFENTEFQEYLCAKEITRLSDPGRAAFSFAVDPDVKEIYPTWFNALTFLVDMQKDLLEQLVEFSGIRTDGFKVVDEGFLKFLSRVDPKNVPTELRRKLFRDVLAYHQRTRQWMNWDLARALPAFFDPSLEIVLKDWVSMAESEIGAKRFVPLGNVAYVVGTLLSQHVQLDQEYWRAQLLAYAADANDNGVLQRHALFALEQLRDPTVIDVVPNLMSAGGLIAEAFLSMCKELDPENPKSLGYFFEAIRRNDFHGRYGLLEIKQSASIKKFLETFNDDENFRREFLDDTSIFKEKDCELAEHIKAVFDDEIAELSKKALVHSVHYNVAHKAEKSFFIMGIWDLLKKKGPNFILDMIDRIQKSPKGQVSWHYAEGFFAKVISKEDVPAFIDAMMAVGQRRSAFYVMLRVKTLADKLEIYEAGRLKLPEEYSQSEAAQADPQNKGWDIDDEELVHRFKTYLESEPGKYNPQVFEFYNQNAQRLDPLLTQDDRNRLLKLLTDSIFMINPVKQELTMTEGGYTTSTAIHIFGDAIITAKNLGIDVTPFRQQILNYIPFAYSEQLRMIFELIQDIKPMEMASVIAVYRERQSDLWRHQAISFVEAVKQYHVIEAVPLLKEFVKESACDKYARQSALTVLDSLAPDTSFLEEVFRLYENAAHDDEKLLAHIANGLLITPHADGEAIRWRLRQVVESASAFIHPDGAHYVGKLEDEITHGKSFAKPLMELERPGYEQDYLLLLDEAIELWAKGKEYYAYAEYLWNIVYAYFDNLKEESSYEPLRLLEKKIVDMSDRDGTNWLASRMVHLRRSYLGYLGKPRNISEAISKYNDSRGFDNKKIQNSVDLFRHLQDAFDVDLRRWIEGEGAYDLLLGEKVFKTKKQEYEKLIQKTLKPQVENVLLRRGFQVEVIREPQLLDEKRTDFLVRYGFAGPIVVEVKLTSNSDIKGLKIAKSASFFSMMRYMDGYGASHGIFLLIDNCGAKNLAEVKKTFETIPNVLVQSFDCSNSVAAVKRRGSATVKAGNRGDKRGRDRKRR